MLKIRTTKPVNTSYHTDEERKIEFRYKFTRKQDQSLVVDVDCYKVIPLEGQISEETPFGVLPGKDMPTEIVEMIPGASSHRELTGDEMLTMVNAAESMSAPRAEGETLLHYFDRIVATGIKLAILQEHLWKDQLEFTDFTGLLD